ncbi:DEAD/DEAH box helicase [Nocardioides sp. KR10-350]|uniref:DEAD/DEAH box helicase n=1 Tax=Nocardioides cheoyonin TaxID=3156615 RepID=UPI0032B36410
MSFVPVTGSAAFRPAEPPREGTVEFSDRRRTVSLPVRAAIPVLTKAHAREDLHPSVALIASATHLALRLVAAGKLEPAEDAASWQVALADGDEERVRLLAEARAYAEVDAASAEVLVRQVLTAVADAMPRSAPVAARRRTPVRPASPEEQTAKAEAFRERLQARLARHVTESTPVSAGLPSLVSVSLRVEADEEELVGGTVRLVPQVHDDNDPLHVVDADRLWTEREGDHGFADRARTHALVALRGASEAWPVLDRLLDLPVPTEITLEGDEIVSLLEHGLGALRERGVDVLWPRSLGPYFNQQSLTSSAVLDRAAPAGGRQWEDLLHDGLFGTQDLFGFRWQVALGGEPLTDEEMDQLAGAAGPVLRLRGSWTVVHPSIARKARKRLLRRLSGGEALAVALTGAPPPEVLAAVEEDAGDEAAQVVVGASIGRLRDAVLAAASGEPVPVPEGLTATLRDYQRHGLSWLAGVTGLGLGCCLADDMGLGKTVTLIALHLHRAERVSTGSTDGGGPTTGPTLVVCPTSLLGNWEDELARFAPGVRVRRHHGSARDLDGLETSGGGEVVLTTYATMRRDVEHLAGVDWGLVVADEAQHVKNASSSTARALRRIPARARVALTGTPVENDLTELWAILDWCVPGLLGSRLAFRRAWASQIESGADTAKARQFAEMVAPFLLRRRKSDPGIAPELPAKTETDHPLMLTREQTVLYEAYVRDTMARIERLDGDDPTRRGLVLMLLTGLKQICNHPAQFLKQQSGRIAGRSQKIDVLDELLETVVSEDGGALVFTQYVAMARLLEAHWSQVGIPHQFLHGGTPVRERERMVAAFQAGEVPVFLLSLKAGGTGLNLTRADHVVHVDRWWNPAVEDQATDRAHRIGQTNPVQVHRLVTRGTVEERVAELLRRKRALAEAVLGRGEAALTELSNAELRDLVMLRKQRPSKRRRIVS